MCVLLPLLIFIKVLEKNAYINLHFSVEAIVQQQVVCHTYTMGFHGMPLSIIIIADITCKLLQQTLFTSITNFNFIARCYSGHFDA